MERWEQGMPQGQIPTTENANAPRTAGLAPARPLRNPQPGMRMPAPFAPAPEGWNAAPAAPQDIQPVNTGMRPPLVWMDETRPAPPVQSGIQPVQGAPTYRQQQPAQQRPMQTARPLQRPQPIQQRPQPIQQRPQSMQPSQPLQASQPTQQTSQLPLHKPQPIPAPRPVQAAPAADNTGRGSGPMRAPTRRYQLSSQRQVPPQGMPPPQGTGMPPSGAMPAQPNAVPMRTMPAVAPQAQPSMSQPAPIAPVTRQPAPPQTMRPAPLPWSTPQPMVKAAAVPHREATVHRAAPAAPQPIEPIKAAQTPQTAPVPVAAVPIPNTAIPAPAGKPQADLPAKKIGKQNPPAMPSAPRAAFTPPNGEKKYTPPVEEDLQQAQPPAQAAGKTQRKRRVDTRAEGNLRVYPEWNDETAPRVPQTSEPEAWNAAGEHPAQLQSDVPGDVRRAHRAHAAAPSPAKDAELPRGETAAPPEMPRMPELSFAPPTNIPAREEEQPVPPPPVPAASGLYTEPEPPEKPKRKRRAWLIVLLLILAAAAALYVTGAYQTLLGYVGIESTGDSGSLPAVFGQSQSATQKVTATITPATSVAAAKLVSVSVTPQQTAAPATLIFTLETNTAATAVRLMTQYGEILHTTATSAPRGDGLTWQVTADFAQAYTGKVRVFLRDAGGTWSEAEEGSSVTVE